MYMSAGLKGAEAEETKEGFEENSRGGSPSVRQNIKLNSVQKQSICKVLWQHSS
jgi:hypothetical protein